MNPASQPTSGTLILASASPRRATILRELGLEVEVHPAGLPEDVLPNESPVAHVERLARAKAEAVGDRFPEGWILAGDTVVILGSDILGKPRDEEDAVRMLLELRGRTHQVASALALVRPERRGPDRDAPLPDSEESPVGARVLSGVETTAVTFRTFDPDVAEAYVATGEPLDKAGAYGIQGKGAALVSGIEGDYTAVVGLPVPLLLKLLEVAGRPYRFGKG